MTLMEAIQTGKPFRVDTWTHDDYMMIESALHPLDVKPYGGGELIWLKSGGRAYLKYKDDILSRQWVVLIG